MLKKLFQPLIGTLLSFAVCTTSFAEIGMTEHTDELTDYVHSIEKGQYLVLGNYNGEDILWRCVDKDSNGALMLSDKIISLKPYDANGLYTSGSHGIGDDSGEQRQAKGSNHWADSNLRAWLNSSATSGKVEWPCGNAPITSAVYQNKNAYADEQGFLKNFSAMEMSAIKTVSIPQIPNDYKYTRAEKGFSTGIKEYKQNYGNIADETTSDRFFLLNYEQAYKTYVAFKDYYYNAIPTKAALEKSQFSTATVEDLTLGSGKPWAYWLRTPAPNNGAQVRIIAGDNKVMAADAYTGYIGVRPAFYLNLSSAQFIAGTGTETDPFFVEERAKAKAEIGTEPVTSVQSVVNSKGDSELTIKKDVKITIGETEVKVGDKTYIMDVAPYIQPESNSTLVPLRFVAIALYADAADTNTNVVEWNADTKTATINANGKLINFTEGSGEMVSGGKVMVMANNVKAEITNGRMFIPFRELGRALGIEVEWDNISKTATYKAG